MKKIIGWMTVLLLVLAAAGAMAGGSISGGDITPGDLETNTIIDSDAILTITPGENESMSISGSISLTFRNGGGILTLSNSSGTVINVNSIHFDGTHIIRPEGAYANNGKIYNKDGSEATFVRIGPSDRFEYEINEDHFPDPNFRSFVNLTYDKNHDMVLAPEEVADVYSMNCSGKMIADMTGIEYFTALQDLDCSSNQLTSLDVSRNTALAALGIEHCHLSSLDLSKNINLHKLYAQDNEFTSLDLSKNTALVFLSCRKNQLTSLDVSRNTSLVVLYCNDNQLTSLDLSRNTILKELDCYNNQLTSLDVSKNTVLVKLSCFGNQINSLDVSNVGYLVYDVGSGRTSGSKYDSFGSGSFCVDHTTAVIAGSTYSAPSIKLIAVTSNGHGIAMASAKSGKTGDTIVLSAIPDKGYELKEWKVISGNVSLLNNTFTIGDYHVEIQAVFEGVPHSIAVESSDPAMGTAGASAESAIIDTEITLTAKPAAGYQLKEWKVLNGDVTVSNNKFTMGVKDVVILAVFKEVPASEDLTPTVGTLKYKISGSNAIVTGPKSKNAKKLTIPKTISANGKTYKVTEIKANAFKGMKKLTAVTIGENVKTIGKSAFQNCAKLKTITIKTKKLTSSSVKSNAFKGIYKKATFKCPKGKASAYKKILLKKGALKTCKFK